jgi:DUF3040 family protein
MAPSSAPGPDDRTPLTPRERQALASIEDSLWDTDPEYAWRMSATATEPHRPVTGSLSGTAAAALLLLSVGALLPPSVRAVLGLVLTLVVLPWLILHGRE